MRIDVRYTAEKNAFRFTSQRLEEMEARQRNTGEWLGNWRKSREAGLFLDHKPCGCAMHTVKQEVIIVPNYRIIVDLSERKLHLLDGNRVIKSYPVGIGKMVTQTPTGEFTIISKAPNPGGPFGAYWMGLSKPHYGIHGTNDPSSIGRMVSRGCIRMHNQHVLELARMVPIGTRVTIRP
jgi:lipoprotein-anchoring transpeptidase ErfK/SrfK